MVLTSRVSSQQSGDGSRLKSSRQVDQPNAQQSGCGHKDKITRDAAGSNPELMRIWPMVLGIVILICVGIVGGYFYYISP